MKGKKNEFGQVFTTPPDQHRDKLTVLRCDKCDESFWTYSPGENYFARLIGSKKARRINYRCKKCGHVSIVAWEPLEESFPDAQ